jgi:Zn-dependent protease with chaperone function
LTRDVHDFSQQVVFMRQKLEELAKKANLAKVPELCVSKTERLANVNVFQRRISIGENLLSLWQQGKFSDSDVEATLAHEVGHLMDFKRDSHSSNFRNLLIESLWFSFGVLPIVIYLLFPNITMIAVSGLIAVGWGFSLPLIVRRVEVRIEFEADKNAALYLVAPQQLADALVKISSFSMHVKTLGLSGKLAFLAGTLTHPSFSERLRYLKNL